MNDYKCKLINFNVQALLRTKVVSKNVIKNQRSKGLEVKIAELHCNLRITLQVKLHFMSNLRLNSIHRYIFKIIKIEGHISLHKKRLRFHKLKTYLNLHRNRFINECAIPKDFSIKVALSDLR